MAEQYRFFGSAVGDTREYSQTEFAEVLATIVGNGYRYQVGDELETIASTPNAMTVETQSGEAWVNGYWYQNDDNKVLTVTTADATNPRIDSVILRLDVLTTRSVVVTILNGTPAVTPVPPTLTQDSQTWEIRLADIYVGAGVVSISDSNITNYKTDLSFIGSGILNYNTERQVLQYSNIDGTTNDIGGETWFTGGVATEYIPNGTPVQFAGVSNDHYTFKIAVPSEINAMPSLFMGIATSNIQANTFGKVTKFGEVNDIDTSSWSVEDILYYDSVNGGLTNVQQSYPNADIQVGAVVKDDATNGVMLVRVTIGDKSKQERLISGTNIKSINGSSILGGGDLDTLTSKTLTTPTISGLMTLNGGQIKFPSTQVPSSDPNTLDDYEEGTWTPTVSGTTTTGTGTYSDRQGYYVKIGKIVHFTLTVVVTAHTGTGNIVISGLPFTSLSAGWIGRPVSVFASVLGFSNQLSAILSSANVYLFTISSGNPEVGVPMDTNFYMTISGTYIVA